MQLNLKVKLAISIKKILKGTVRFYGLALLFILSAALGGIPRNLNLDHTKSVASFDSVGLGEIVIPTVLKNTTVLNGNNANGFVGVSGGFVKSLPQFVQSVSGPIQIYVRTWTTKGSNSEIAIEAIETQTSSGAQSAFNSAKSSFDDIKGNMKVIKTGTLSEIPQSVLTEMRGNVSGVVVTSLQVFFVARNIIFIVRMDSASHLIMTAQLEQISIAQKNRADKYVIIQSASNSQTPYLIVLGFIVLLVLLLIILLHINSERRQSARQDKTNLRALK